MKVGEITRPMDESRYTEFSSRVAMIWNYFNTKKGKQTPHPRTHDTDNRNTTTGTWALRPQTTLWGDLPGLILYRYTLRPLFTPCLDPSP